MPTEFDLEKGFGIGDNICIRIGGTKKYYKVTNRDNLFYLDQPAAIAADTTATYAEVTNLNPPHGQLYQVYKVWIDGNVYLYLKQPAATNRWGTQRSPEGGFINDRTSGVKGGMFTDLWFTIDNPPSIQLVNQQPVSITPKIWYIGWRYAIEELRSMPATFTEVTISGIAQ
jgi:hypothetical protein